jgi:F-type H+-transporting ATPase subunit a
MATAGHSSFSFLQQIPGLEHVPNHILTAGFVGITLILTSWVARLQLKTAMQRPDGGIVPDRTLTYRNFFEIVAEKLYGLTESVIGHHDAPTFFPVIGSLFVFIFTSNILGLVPGLGASTDNINTTLALGIFVFIYYNYAGFKANGVGYLKHFLGPMLALAPLMLVIELASHVFRPLSLALRLRGNIMGDHVVLGIFSDLVPYLLPVIFYGLGAFVAFIQAFVFCLMTMVYISMSTSHDH